MTPRQTITMVVSTVAGTDLAAIPAGVTLHRYVLPVMSHAVQSALPAAVPDVYRAPELVVLALSGLAIAVAGALAPAGWAARAHTASAPSSAPVLGRSKNFAAGVHFGIAGSKHQ